MRRYTFRRTVGQRTPRWFVTVVGIVLAFCTLPAAADSPVSAGSAAYLAQHQSELVPFFEQHGFAMFKDSLPIVISVLGNLLLAAALFGWVLDIPLSWGFSTIFSPAYAKFTRAVLYASGRLVLALLLTMVLSFSALLGLNAGAGLPALIIVLVLALPAVALQIFWVGYLYRTGARTSTLFYFSLLLAHALAVLILVPTLFHRPLDLAMSQAINQSVVPSLQVEADQAQRDAATAADKRDGIQAEVTALQEHIAQDQAAEQGLQKLIATYRDSPAATFRQLVLLRAQGKLVDAAKGLADFIHHHPDDPLADPARGQITEINRALSAQMVLERQAEAAKTAADARARARLLAHTGVGEATLSEVRRALMGRTMAEVSSLFGPPTATAADRWGYARRMIFDPDTKESLGLTVVFSEGLVQGVDYYYGVGP